MSDTTAWTYHVVLGDGTETVMEVGPYPTVTAALANAAQFMGMTAKAVDDAVVAESITIAIPSNKPQADWHTNEETHGEHRLIGYTIERYDPSRGETDGSWSLNGGLRASIREAAAA